MKSGLGKSGVVVRYIMLVIVFLSLISCEKFYKEVTVYPVMKTDKGLEPLNRTTYKVFPESQTIIYWTPNFDLPVGKLKNCIVRDRLNWSGEFRDGSAKFTMVNGTFSQTDPVPHGNIQYVGKWKWWMLHLRWMVFGEKGG